MSAVTTVLPRPLPSSCAPRGESSSLNPGRAEPGPDRGDELEGPEPRPMSSPALIHHEFNKITKSLYLQLSAARSRTYQKQIER